VLGVLLHLAARRAQRAEGELQKRRALAALGEMAAVLAHEIRTPLASIKGNAQLIGEGAPEDDRPRSIVDESARLERLVNGMLDYARPVEPRREPCDPDALIERAAGLTVPRAAATGVALVTDPARCGSCLSADPDQILQVLVNLLQNAIEATAGLPEGAPRDPVVIRARRASGQVILSVQDAGVGLPVGGAEQIFLPFYSGKRQGTGLGLSVARQIVEQHGGVLEVLPRKEGGVLATATLPEGKR
jgi:two-component system sensor histidine kinase HydH